MRKLIVVCRFYGPIDIAEDREHVERYREIKSAALPYCDVLISRQAHVRQAPLGAVRSAADGERLIAALSKHLPRLKFTLATVLCDRDEEIVFVPCDARPEGSCECMPAPSGRFHRALTSPR
jgi:hypothetical protein